MKEQRQSSEPTGIVNDGLIMFLWSRKFDTYEIAKQLRLHEWQVANRLLHLREASR